MSNYSMTSREFCMWLEGYLDNRGKLHPSEVNEVKDKLKQICDELPKPGEQHQTRAVERG